MNELDPYFDNEVQNLARVCKLSTKNILRYVKHFYLRKEQKQILITEYCDNTMDGLLAKKGQLEEIVAQKYFIDILEGVKTMHKAGVMHRDLKTENIFIKNNVAKIGDFGFSSTKALANSIIGSPLY